MQHGWPESFAIIQDIPNIASSVPRYPQCVALSSNDSVLAAGDVTGRVLIWRDFAAAVPADLREGVATGKKRAECSRFSPTHTDTLLLWTT
eukprot:1142459-Pelagomonas_calceolata.AAC.2